MVLPMFFHMFCYMCVSVCVVPMLFFLFLFFMVFSYASLLCLFHMLFGYVVFLCLCCICVCICCIYYDFPDDVVLCVICVFPMSFSSYVFFFDVVFHMPFPMLLSYVLFLCFFFFSYGVVICVFHMRVSYVFFICGVSMFPMCFCDVFSHMSLYVFSYAVFPMRYPCVLFIGCVPMSFPYVRCICVFHMVWHTCVSYVCPYVFDRCGFLCCFICVFRMRFLVYVPMFFLCVFHMRMQLRCFPMCFPYVVFICVFPMFLCRMCFSDVLFRMCFSYVLSYGVLI